MNGNDEQAVSVKANVNEVNVKRANASGRNQNRLHVQKALLEFLVCGRDRIPEAA
jgi:hypothetical protein